MKTIDEIIEEFEKTMLNKLEYIGQDKHKQNLKDFLRQALASYKKEIEERMPKEEMIMNNSIDFLTERLRGYNQALKEVKDLLNKI